MTGSLRGVPSRLIGTVRNARKGRCQTRSPAVKRRLLRPPSAPPGRESEVTFISGVTADATVAATSFGAWGLSGPPSIPAQYNPYYSNTTKWGDPTLQLAGTPAVVTYQFDNESNWSDERKAPGSRLWRCGRRKSRSHSHSRQDGMPISPSISSRFPVLPTLRPAHSSPFPTERPRKSAATSRAFPGPTPSSRSISQQRAPTPRATPNRSTQFRRQQRFLFRPDP